MEKGESKSLKKSFVDIIESKILSGELQPGDRLPPEREMAKDAGISRGSVNQAVLDLERMGFLRIVPRKGTFVAEYSRNATPETLSALIRRDKALTNPRLFADFMEFRILVERECTRLACINLTEESLAVLRKATEGVVSAEKENLVDAVYEYHRCITEISGNGAYHMVFQSFEKMIRNLIGEHFRYQEGLEESVVQIKELTEAIAERDEKKADALMTTILVSASDYLGRKFTEADGKQPVTPF